MTFDVAAYMQLKPNEKQSVDAWIESHGVAVGDVYAIDLSADEVTFYRFERPRRVEGSRAAKQPPLTVALRSEFPVKVEQ